MKLIEDLGRQYSTPTSKIKRRFGIYECPICGIHFRANTYHVNNDGLDSCRKCSNITHGLRRHKLYEVWANMKKRCYNKNEKAYKDYGGRGIIVCPEWLHDFKAFYEWATSHGWNSDLEIDRENTNRNYTPDNCIFSTIPDNCQNRRLLNSKNTSGYHGVNWHKNIKKWQAGITSYKIKYFLGYFYDIHLAAVAYNNFVISHKTHHPLNPIPPEYQHLIINPE